MNVNDVKIQPLTELLTLEEVKQQKIIELNQKCEDAIMAGFYSSVKGEPHLYGFDRDDQKNWTDGLMLIDEGIITDTINAKYKGGRFEPYTIAEYKQLVLMDAAAHKLMQLGKNDTLKISVDNATTKEEVNSIVW